MRTDGASNWTPEQEQQLRQLWDEGFSASEISARMRFSSRSGICAKARRMKLSHRKQQNNQQPRTKREAAKDIGLINRMNIRIKHLPVMKPGEMRFLKGTAWEPLPGTLPVSLVDLEAGMCRWPIGKDKPFLFCGTDALHGPYCEHHTTIAAGEGTMTERAAVKFAVDANKAEWRRGERAREAA